MSDPEVLLRATVDKWSTVQLNNAAIIDEEFAAVAARELDWSYEQAARYADVVCRQNTATILEQLQGAETIKDCLNLGDDFDMPLHVCDWDTLAQFDESDVLFPSGHRTTLGNMTGLDLRLMGVELNEQV